MLIYKYCWYKDPKVWSAAALLLGMGGVWLSKFF